MVPPSSRCAPLSGLSSRWLASAECGPSGRQQEGAESNTFIATTRDWLALSRGLLLAGALEVVLFYLVSLRRRADGREAGLSAMPSRSAAEQRAVIQRRAASADRERSVAFSHDLCEFSVWLFRSDSRVCPEENNPLQKETKPL